MSAEVTRRQLLRSLGVAGGAGVMFEAMRALGFAGTAEAADYQAPKRSDFSTTGRVAPRVVILGAGIAGLATAYELGKAGYLCTILEAKGRVGGRNWTIREGTSETDLDGHHQYSQFAPGQYFNAGPARIAQSHLTLDYCRELGVPVEAFVNQNANAYVYNQNMPAPTRFRTAKADMYGYVSELLAKALDQGALDQRVSAVDKDRLLTFLSDWGAIGPKADGFAYRGTDRRGYVVDPGPADQAGTQLGSPDAISDVLARQVGRNFSFELGYDQAMMMMQPVGGMDAIPRALVDAVGAGNIRVGAKVTRVADKPTGVDVFYRDRYGVECLIQAEFCVSALPPQVMARIPTNLDPAVGAALRYPVVVPVGKLGLEQRRRWWETDLRIYGGITATDMDIVQIWYPSSGFHGQRGVLLGYYHYGPHALTYSALTPAQRVEKALTQGTRIHGDVYRAEYASGFSVAWHRTPHIEGGWVEWPSRTTGEYALLNTPAGHVYFAGDWLTYEIAWQAGAFGSARRAVSAIHQRVMG